MMAIQFTFYRVSEKKPKHNEEIIWLKSTSVFAYYGFEPKEVTVEYCWSEVDETGTPTGNQCCYSEEDGEDLEEHILQIMFGGYFAEDNWLWCSVDEYWDAFDNEITLKETNENTFQLIHI